MRIDVQSQCRVHLFLTPIAASGSLDRAVSNLKTAATGLVRQRRRALMEHRGHGRDAYAERGSVAPWPVRGRARVLLIALVCAAIRHEAMAAEVGDQSGSPHADGHLSPI